MGKEILGAMRVSAVGDIGLCVLRTLVIASSRWFILLRVSLAFAGSIGRVSSHHFH